MKKIHGLLIALTLLFYSSSYASNAPKEWDTIFDTSFDSFTSSGSGSPSSKTPLSLHASLIDKAMKTNARVCFTSSACQEYNGIIVNNLHDFFVLYLPRDPQHLVFLGKNHIVKIAFPSNLQSLQESTDSLKFNATGLIQKAIENKAQVSITSCESQYYSGTLQGDDRNFLVMKLSKCDRRLLSFNKSQIAIMSLPINLLGNTSAR